MDTINSGNRTIASIVCILMILMTFNNFSFVNAAGDPTFTISPSYSSSSTLSTKLITVTASSNAFSPGSAYPRFYKSGVLQNVTFTNVDSTATQLTFKIATTLSNGSYTLNVDGPVGYRHTGIATFIIGEASVSGSVPLIKLLKGYNTQQTASITGVNSNFSLGQTTVEILSGSTLVDTATVTAVNAATQRLSFSINAGLSSGDYNLRITTGSEVINVVNGLKVYNSQSISLGTSTLTSSYSPGTNITVTGTNTLFDSSKTTVKILDSNGMDTGKVGSSAIVSATSLTFSVNSGLTAGGYSLQVTTTGTSEAAPTAPLIVSQPSGALKKSSIAITEIGSGYPNLSLVIEGTNTGFQSGSTTLSVFSINGEAETLLNGKISGTPSISGQNITFTLAGGASGLNAGSYKFKAVTNLETVEVPFTVVNSSLANVQYNSTVVNNNGARPVLALGYKSFTVNVTGSNTHFSNNTTVTVNGSTLTANYTSSTAISFTMPEGINTGSSKVISIDMDGDPQTVNDILTTLFDVGAQATILSISPDSVVNVAGADPVTIAVTGSNTHFTAASGTPSVDITGFTGETITNVNVISDTALTFVLAPNTITSLGGYGISITTNNASKISETATGTNLLTVKNQGFVNNTPILYTLGVSTDVVEVKAINLTLRESATVAINNGSSDYNASDVSINAGTGTITFKLPSQIIQSGAGSYTIKINNDGTEYTTNLSLVQSYINSFTPSYKVYGYSDGAITITGNNTVDFSSINPPSVLIKQGVTILNTVSSGNVNVNENDNTINFNIPGGLNVGNYSLQLSWAAGEYAGDTLAVTGYFEIKNEISALTLTYNNSDAGSSITTYLNKGTISIAAIGTKAQEIGTVNRTSTGAVWTSSNQSVATVSNGTVSISGVGTSTITGAWNGKEDTVQLIVSAPASIDINGAGGTIYLGGQLQLTATANYGDSSTQDISNLVTWVSGDTNKATISNSGLVTAKEFGQVSISATFATKSSTYNLSVSSMALSPSTINTVALIDGKTLTVTGIDVSGGTGDIDVTVNGVNKDATIAGVTANSFTIQPGNLQPGEYTVAVTKSGRTYNKTLTIAQSSITPNVASLLTDYEVFTMNITGNNASFDNSSRKPSVYVNDNVVNGANVTVDEGTNKVSFPFPTGLNAGSHTVRFSWNSGAYAGKQLTATVEVIDANIDSIEIYQGATKVVAPVSVTENEIVQLSMKAFEGNTLIADLTSMGAWSSNDETIATVSADGMVTGVGSGNVTITVGYLEFSDSVSVSVTGLPDPIITSFNTTGATLTEGSISGNITITGSNFSSISLNNSVEIIESGTNNIAGNASIVSSTTTTIVAALPTGLLEGTYKVRVTVYGKSGTSPGTFAISGLQSPGVSPSPTPSAGSGFIGGDMGFVLPSPTPIPIPDERKDITIFDGEKINEAIENIKGKKELTFDLNDGDKSVKELVLEKAAVSSLLDKKVDIVIETKNVGIQVPVEIFKQHANKDVKIEVIAIEGNEREELFKTISDSMKNMTGNSPVVDLRIRVVSDSKEEYVGNFSKKITLELTVNEADLKSVDKKKLGVYYLDEVKKSWNYVGGKYNSKTGRVEAKTSHFTKFTVFEYNKKFKDIKTNSWAKDYIELLASKHITQGMDEDNFVPHGLVTRAQFATFLVKALNIDTGVYQGKFKDVGRGKWYSVYIEAAERSGLVRGYGNGVFSPDANITREQMAVMIVNAQKFVSGNSGGSNKSVSKFKDDDKLSSWSKNAVYEAQSMGIINGLPGNIYSPSDNAKREQAARVIIGLLEVAGEI